MGFLSRDELLAAGAATLPRETVHVPLLGGDVCVQGLSVAGRDKYLEECQTGRGRKQRVVLSRVRTKLLRRCIVDPETFAPMFLEADEPLIAKWRSDVAEQLFDVAQRLSGLTNQDDKDDEGDAGNE